MAKRSLQTGVAYHGNRMLSHVREDMKRISQADMDIVVHMLSHTDWERHKTVLKDIIAITEDAGMEVWVDNWGLGGSPGDKSHFLAYCPDAHMYNSDGTMHPSQVCLNSPEYRKFVKQWLDTVAEIGGKTVFWDEPFFPTQRPKSADDKEVVYTCRCPRCQKLFFERYGHEMPRYLDAEAEEFRSNTLVDYFDEITSYSASLGLYNAVCVMLHPHLGISLDTLDRICSLPHLHNVGSDPYWYAKKDANPYGFVYEKAKKNVEIAERFHKDHNVWIQTYNVPRGREEEIIEATAAAYDAGARTILAWGYMGSESNDYRAQNPERTWNTTVEAMARIRNEERNRIWEENRKKYMK